MQGTLATPNKVLVDPRNYRSFCFRGEGRANFVISAKHRLTGLRIVWRFSKARQSGLMTVKARSELVNNYMERIVTPLFDQQYLVDMNIVEFLPDDVHQLAKIPSLPANEKVEAFEDLYRYPEEFSFLPLSSYRRIEGDTVTNHPKRLSSLQMLDATQIPNSHCIDTYNSSTITVEIKPKQGFLQNHDGVNIPHCNNCIMQMEKCGSSHFSEMYDFCPLDLFSGSYSRMRKAIHSLFLVPHRNLRVFVDGNLIHSDEKPLEQKDLNPALFPLQNATLDDLISVLCLTLSGNSSRKKFKLKKSSVLGQILRAQKIDEIGIVKAYSLYERLETELQEVLLDKTNVSRLGIDAILQNTNEQYMSRNSTENDLSVQQLRRYFVSATMKDCSVMVSMRYLPPDISVYPPNVVHLPNGRSFAFSIKIVDLDPKTPKNLLNSYSRFMTGVKLIKLENERRNAIIEEHRENCSRLSPCKQ